MFGLNFQDFGEDCSSESESDEDCVSDSENEDANDVSNDEDYTSSGETNGSDNEIDLQASAEALKKLIPCDLEEFEKVTLLALKLILRHITELISAHELTETRDIIFIHKWKYKCSSTIISRNLLALITFRITKVRRTLGLKESSNR